MQKIQELEDENSSFTTLIDPEDYFNYSNTFDELNKLFRKREEENYMKKSKKYKDLYDNFNKSFRNSFLNFISIPNNKEVIERIKNIEKNINKIMKEDKETMLKTKKYLDLLYNNVSTNNTKLLIEKFEKLRPIIEFLYEEGKN